MTIIRVNGSEDDNLIEIGKVIENQWYLVYSGPCESFINKIGICFMRDFNRGDGPKPVIILTDGSTISSKDFRFKEIKSMNIKYEI